MIARFRIPFILLAMANLLAGLWSGMIRIGWDLPVSTVAVHHGAIMIGGFFTTLIALEKVIPLKKKFAFVVPAVSALSLTMTIDGCYTFGMVCFVSGSAGLLIIQCLYLYKFPKDRSSILMIIGAGLLVTGNVLLASSRFYPPSFPWWMGFLLFTIVGERLELSRFLPVSEKARWWLFGFLIGFASGLILPFHGVGKYVSGMALVGVAVWLLRYDVIKIGLRNNGLIRYSSVALLLGNLALMLEGIFLLALPDTMLAYDSMVHTFFIGFGVTMVFAHGPVILPAVLGITKKPYARILYVWLIILQGSLYFRLLADTLVETEWRQWSGLITATTMLLYFVTIILLILRRTKN